MMSLRGTAVTSIRGRRCWQSMCGYSDHGRHLLFTGDSNHLVAFDPATGKIVVGKR
jgi:hypothetical protein